MKRNYGIDVLKILAAFMIVLHHLLIHGGIIDACVDQSANYYWARILNGFAYLGVDLFGMITGWLMTGRQFHSYHVVTRWLQGVFIGVLITLAVQAYDPLQVNAVIWKAAFLPLYGNSWWYFTAYTAMCFFLPAMLKLVETMNEKMHFMLTAGILFVFCFLDLFTDEDIFSMNFGLCLLWLICLFFIGSYIRKYSCRPSCTSSCVLAFLISMFTAIATQELHKRGLLSFELFGYNSLTFVIACCCLIKLFSKMEIHSSVWQKALKVCSSTTLGIYMLDDHPLSRNILIGRRFSFFAYFSAGRMIAMTIVLALIITAASVGIDLLRQKLFRVAHVEELSKWIAEKVERLFSGEKYAKA